MSWIQRLYETYERCAEHEPPGSERLIPVAHTTQQAQIEIVIDVQGYFRRASVIPKDQQTTLVPCTEQSGSRSGRKPANHPLCDKLQYVAGDFVKSGGQVTSGFSNDPAVPHSDYLTLLEKWSTHDRPSSKIRAILAYAKRGCTIRDLVEASVLPGVLRPDGSCRLVRKWTGKSTDAPEIFRAVPTGQSPEDSFVRWRVEGPGVLATGTWEDQELVSSWKAFYSTQQTTEGTCMVNGETCVLADSHPKKIRHAGDQAKLISSNDTSGFTFLGRFTDATQAASVSYDVTQKAHNALRWLIGRKQAFRNGNQVFVSWAVGGQSIPDPWVNSKDLFGDGDSTMPDAPDSTQSREPGDVGQSFSFRLNRAIAGYKASLEDNADIVVMGLDSATPGRMAITFYRELKGSEFLQRILRWHESIAWVQNFGKDTRFVGAPGPRDVAEAAYGRRLDDALRKSTVERLLPCIVDGESLPKDLIESSVRRVSNRIGLEPWEWEKCLGIACALYKGFHDERRYHMSLEEERKTRDYLYGRLLAVAEHIESRALYVAGENRDTMAARLMQRFADRPHSTWRTIELSLTPYKSRLRASRPGFLWEMEKIIDSLINSFSSEDRNDAFTNDRPLSGEFLLGFHCQRRALRQQPESKTSNESEESPTN